MSVELRVVADPTAACVDELHGALSSDLPLVLTGGSTVKVYKSAAATDPARWSGAGLWFTDERCVPVSDARSNYGAVSAALLAPLRAQDVEVEYCERMRGEEDRDAAATAYEARLRERGVSAFGLVLLGLGPDGHICSMFPGQPAVDERQRLVVGVPEAGLEPFVPRISLTFPALAMARRVVVMAAGAGKADAVAAAFAPDAPASREVPASLLREFCDAVVVILDGASAVRL
jgi:6-phosphogluconolactonase